MDTYSPRKVDGPRQAIVVILAVFLLASAPAAIGQGVERELAEQGGWSVTDKPPEVGPEAELARARQALADGRYSQAVRLADRWIEAHASHALAPEAYLVRGDARFLNRDYYKALFDYELVARQFPASEAFGFAIEREYEIARMFARGTKRKLWGMRIIRAYTDSEELLIRVQERMPGSRLAQNAGRELADGYFRRRKMDLATTAYDLYIENYPAAEDRPEAMQRLIYSYLATFKGPDFDPSGLYNARVWLDRLRNMYPAEAQQMGAPAIQTRIDESDAEQMLVTAKWYLDRGDEVSTRFTLKRLLQRYPETIAANKAYRVMVARGWIEPEPEPERESESESEEPSGTPTDAGAANDSEHETTPDSSNASGTADEPAGRPNDGSSNDTGTD